MDFSNIALGAGSTQRCEDNKVEPSYNVHVVTLTHCHYFRIPASTYMQQDK